jgi:hypothetical protein
LSRYLLPDVEPCSTPLVQSAQAERCQFLQTCDQRDSRINLELYTIFIAILRVGFMDFMLEEELIDLYTFCLQNPDSPEVEQKKSRITEVGKEIFDDGGVDALENFYFAISNRIQGEIEKDIAPFRPLWNGFSDEWKY